MDMKFCKWGREEGLPREGKGMGKTKQVISCMRTNSG